MRSETKKKLVPSGCETEEFTRFDALLRDVLRVPKKEIVDRDVKKGREKKQRKRTT
jgi:hypothetical protein